MPSPRLVQRPSLVSSTLPFSLGTTVVCYKLNIAPALSRDLSVTCGSAYACRHRKAVPALVLVRFVWFIEAAGLGSRAQATATPA